MAFFSGLPYIVAVQGDVLVVFSSPVAHAKREVDVQAVCNGQRVTVFHACRVIRLGPKCSAGFSAHVTFSSPLKVVSERLPVYAYMMSGERLFIGLLPEPVAHGKVTSIDAPVTVAAVLFPPAVHPVATD